MTKFLRGGRYRERGVVLLITLALVVLITFAVVGYFSRTITNRRIENAGSAAIMADTLARAAAQIVVSDLETEIVAGSAVSQVGNQMPIYRPNNPQEAVPVRVVTPGVASGGAAFNSLVKQSSGRFFSGAGFATTPTPLITATTGRDTSVTSVNNRNVSTQRWNTPVMNTQGGFSSAGQLPQWILVDRQGVASSQAWSTTFRDYSPGNNSAVIGRFAFNVYDEGGLLDANVAGNPVFTTALTDAQIQQLKSTQAGAAFYDRVSGTAIIPNFTSTMQNAFVNVWRYGSTATSSANFFLDFMSRTVPWSTTVSPTFADSGFMRPTVRDVTSASSDTNTIAYYRQDLIRMTGASVSGIVVNYLTTAALPYFTHFSRELNSPSWYPQQNASDMPTHSGTVNPVFEYFTNRESALASNRFIPNVRVLHTFTRADGTTAVVGEPLIKNRFPLRRLDGIAYNGVSGSAFPVMVGATLQYPIATTIQRDFGLAWNSGNNRWDYVGATGNTVQSAIATLDQVASANREPNFFEILKASILSGSLGLGTDNTGAGKTFVEAEARFYQSPQSSDAQIIQIGANIIDQWDADKNPTFIQFGSDEYAGIENLPYLNKLGYQCRWSTSSPVTFKGFLVPSFWTPAQNAAAVGTQSNTLPLIRFIMTSGTVKGVIESASTFADSIVISGGASPVMNLTQSANFGTSPNGSGATGTGMSQTIDSKYGILLTFSSTGGITAATTVRSYPVITNATFEMQAQIGGSSGTWKTYQRWSSANINTSGKTSVCEPPSGSGAAFWTSSTIPLFDPEFVMLDPRTMRFGVWETHASATGDSADFNYGVLETLDRDVNARSPATPSSPAFQKITGLGPQGSSFSGVGAEMANNTSTAPNYRDLDGVLRRGDYIASSSTSALRPANSNDRSPILNSVGRQLRTVSELGTVFRDQPWKTLNFTTIDSGDAGLLDAFTIFEPNSIFRSDIVAGKLSLNTKQSLVLRAVLNGVATNTNNSTPLINITQRDQIADSLVAMTTAQPMISKSELVTRFASDPSVTSLGNKEAREAVIRALADVGQTRTWNLMIDVIAQSGRYSINAASVDDFIVGGEKRYWLHVAIDRYTGEIIDQQLEPVYE